MIIESYGKRLHVFALNLNSADEPLPDVMKLIEPIFSELAPYLKRTEHALYIRDIKAYAIEDRYIGGNAYIPDEVRIAVPQWPVDEAELIATLAHELHHIARWQNAGYGNTLGGAITSEGMAVYYEELKSGWLPPWAEVRVSEQIWQRAAQEWSDASYNHQEWFFEGKLGKWIGYGMGYQLAQRFFEKGFDLEKSLVAIDKEFKKLMS